MGALSPRPEEIAFAEQVKAARHLYFVVHSENPAHYTELEVHKEPFELIFRDSLKDPPESPPRMVERILKNLQLVTENWVCPPRSNEVTQLNC